MVSIQHFHCHGPGSIPGWGTKIPQHGQKTNKQTKNKQKKTGMEADGTSPGTYMSIKREEILEKSVEHSKKWAENKSEL